MRYRQLVICLVLSICVAAAAEDWPKYRRDYSNTGHSAEHGVLANGVTTVSSSTISSLSLKWSRNIGGKISGTPAVVGGVVYVGTWSGYVYALDAVSGAVKWSHNVCSCRIAGSPMVTGGVVYIGAANATVYALSTSTGAIFWARQVTSQSGAEIWSSPVVYNGQVYVGVASHSDAPCIKGAIYALNAQYGTITWTFNTLNQATCPTGAGTCTGAGVWTSAAVDTANGIVYFGTGNPGASCSPSTANATQYPDSILALRANGLTLVNYFKAVSNDTYDDDFGSSPVLLTTGATSACAGSNANHNWVAEANKNGQMYFLLRGSGGLAGGLHQIGVGSSPVTSPAVLSWCPAGGAGMESNLYITNLSHSFLAVNQNPAGALAIPFNRYVSSYLMYSAPAIVNDVVLFGSQDYKLHGATTSGALVWSFPTGGRVNSGPSVSNGRIYFGSEDYHIYCLSVGGK